MPLCARAAAAAGLIRICAWSLGIGDIWAVACVEVWRAPIQEVGGSVLSTREDDKHARGGLEHVGSPIVCFIEKGGEKGK